jgi:hypothetical protein
MTIISAMSEPTDKELKQAWANTPITQTPQPVKTLRDEFAMAAMTGMINYMANMKVKTGGLGYEVTINMPEVAMAAYEYADAMMKQREA